MVKVCRDIIKENYSRKTAKAGKSKKKKRKI
jgi:hypothetical protein